VQQLGVAAAERKRWKKGTSILRKGNSWFHPRYDPKGGGWGRVNAFGPWTKRGREKGNADIWFGGGRR